MSQYSFEGREIPEDTLNWFLTYVGKFRNLEIEQHEYAPLMVEILEEIADVNSSRAKRSILTRRCQEFIDRHISERLSDAQEGVSS